MTWLDGYWLGIQDGDPRASNLYERHYSAVNLKARRRRGDKRICGPGQHIVLMTAECDALFVWRRSNRPDLAGQMGVYCSIFRNEGVYLSSALIREAEEIAWRRWPGERLYTYVNGSRIRSSNPGCCFLKAGWRRCGLTAGGLVILEKTGGNEHAANKQNPNDRHR